MNIFQAQYELLFIPMFFVIRKLRRIFAQLFIPTGIMVVLSWFTFLIPPASYPGRFGSLVALILVLINITLRVIDSSPVLSGVCGLTVWTTICLLMVSTYT